MALAASGDVGGASWAAAACAVLAFVAHEWQIIKIHTTEGQQLLDRVGGFMSQVGRIVRSHHERWDGGGYPDSLAGEAIPLESRVIAACDAWKAMTTDRPYRRALDPAAAMAELASCAGSQFDPAVVHVVLGIVAEHHPPAESV